MLAITVELLHGMMRAAAADDTALAGRGGSGEWPPSPARLFAALVAADRTGDRCRVTDGSELRTIEEAAPPIIFADRRERVLLSDVHERFVVLNKAHDGSVQQYPGRQAGVVRPGTRTAPFAPLITYVWPDLELDATQLEAVAARAARIGYFGCADSPARVKVATALPDGGSQESWVPDPTGSTIVPVPFRGLVDVLDSAFAQFEAGVLVRRSWFATRPERYRGPDDRVAVPESIVLWLRFEQPVPGRRVVMVAETLRDAVLDLYEPVDGDGSEADERGVPPVLHGHGMSGSGYQTACYLPLPDVGFPHSRGRIHGAALVLPSDASAEVVQGVRRALARLRTLARPNMFEVQVVASGGQGRPRAAQPGRWRRPSNRFVSAFPVVHERHRRHGPTLDDVAAWCEHAGLNTPVVGFRVCEVPLVPGGLSLRADEVYRQGRDRGPYSHLEVEFAEPVRGPFALGRSRQFGLGLMVPVSRTS
jgi:CRISPR-associated protein Csb2